MIQDPLTPDPLAAMNVADTKEYILALITTLKLTEKEIYSLEEDAAKWNTRADLARSRGAAELLTAAEKEAERANVRLIELRGEAGSLREQIDSLRRRLPALAARERNIDPDLLEQELLMALGRTGEDDAVKTDRAFEKLEKENAADAALQALKAKLNR